MSEKWYVVKLSKEEKLKSGGLGYMTFIGYDGIEEHMNRYGDIPILVTPSEELAKSTTKALNGKL